VANNEVELYTQTTEEIDYRDLHGCQAKHSIHHRPLSILCQLALYAGKEKIREIPHGLLAVLLLDQNSIVLFDRTRPILALAMESVRTGSENLVEVSGWELQRTHAQRQHESVCLDHERENGE